MSVAIAPKVIKPVTMTTVDNCFTSKVSSPGTKVMLRKPIRYKPNKVIEANLRPFTYRLFIKSSFSIFTK